LSWRATALYAVKGNTMIQRMVCVIEPRDGQ
jgi:hypothetical protein